jgi:2'-5' RNA ligase
MTNVPPLILTLVIDDGAFAYFDELRRRHFPPKRNLLPAHLTLFHALPGNDESEIVRDIAAACRSQAAIRLVVTGLRSLGRGVAFNLESAELDALRDRLAQGWRSRLTAQDRQKHRPHVTVQNKVDPSDARTLLAELQTGFAPFAATGEGLALWQYRGGPWEPVRRFPFEGGESG